MKMIENCEVPQVEIIEVEKSNISFCDYETIFFSFV